MPIKMYVLSSFYKGTDIIMVCVDMVAGFRHGHMVIVVPRRPQQSLKIITPGQANIKLFIGPHPRMSLYRN